MNMFTESVPFYKMNGCGNDFVIIDNRELKVNTSVMGQWAKALCRKGFGIHADGLFFLDTPPENSDLAYIWHFYNNDGSCAEMCGNASRCAARLAHSIGMAPAEHTFGTLAGNVKARVIEEGSQAGEVSVQLTRPDRVELNIDLELGDRSLTVHHVVVGVPHAVVFVEDVNAVNVLDMGRMICHHEQFAPAATNVNFVQLKDSRTLLIRTYERGVEDETFACGTGAASTQFLSHLLNYTEKCAELHTVKGLELTVDIQGEDVFLQGPAELTFKGEFYPAALGLQSV